MLRILPPQEPLAAPDGTSYRFLWNIAGECWNWEPSERPTMAQILDQLRHFLSEPLPRIDVPATVGDTIESGPRPPADTTQSQEEEQPPLVPDPWIGVQSYTSSIDMSSAKRISWTNYSKTYTIKLSPNETVSPLSI